MSTVCKLDRNISLDRHLRLLQLREMRGDLATIQGLINRGHQVAAGFNERTTLPARQAHRKIMADMLLKRAVLEMVLTHLTKIARDPRRSGAVKDAIFLKLGSTPETRDEQ